MQQRKVFYMLFTRNNMKSLIVEGNIGAGKSTFLKLINQHLDAQIVYEPLDRWQHINESENLLEKFYNDTPRWAYTFQTYAFITRILESEAASQKAVESTQILERSVYSDRYCFAKNLYQMGKMTSLEWKLYQEWFSWLIDTYTKKPDGFIYIKTTPETCYSRLKKRNRSEESAVSFEYLKMVHDRHEEWLIEKKDIADYLKETPVLVLECNSEFETESAQLEKHVEEIKDFFGVALRNNSNPKAYTEKSL
jgi:deoxyadenosine/deoxycytidine kinase